MSEQAKPARKRIVPQQILSPTKSFSQSQAETERPVGPCTEVGDLKEQSQLAARLLGPGRKIYVDLRTHQAGQKPVDWKEASRVAQRAPRSPALLVATFARGLILRLRGGPSLPGAAAQGARGEGRCKAGENRGAAGRVRRRRRRAQGCGRSGGHEPSGVRHPEAGALPGHGELPPTLPLSPLPCRACPVAPAPLALRRPFSGATQPACRRPTSPATLTTPRRNPGRRPGRRP